MPKSFVTGHITIAGPGMNAVQLMSTPFGANTWCVYSGLWPCVSAHGVHASAHRKKSASARPFWMYRVEKWASAGIPHRRIDTVR